MKRILVLSVSALLLLSPRAGAQDFDLSRLEIPEGFLDLADIQVTMRSDGSITGTGYATLMNANTFVLLSSIPPTSNGGRRGAILALKPDDWSLASLPGLAVPGLDGLTLSNVALVITDQDVRMSSDILHEQDYEFYREVYQTDTYELVLKPGINLIAAIPVENLEEGHPLLVIMDALGIEKGVVLLQGTLGRSLALIGAGGGGGNIVRDLYLRAELPPMRPPGSPEWFHSGQLALEITGLPSLRLVGEMNVNIQDDLLMFFAAATLARTGMTLSGGLQADEDGWVAPFGIEWLTLNKVVLMLGVTTTGSVQLGFAGDAVFGEKDIAVAVAIAISPAGVPTNFLMQGESEAGVALSDIAMVQEGMARAAGRDEPRLPISQLPDMAITNMGLRFAPRPEPALGIERGMALKGRLWLQTTPGGELTDFAGVDVNVGDEGFWIRGDVATFALGPLKLSETTIDVTATWQAQYFLLKGEAELFGARQMLDLYLSRQRFWFTSETRIFDLFSADLSVDGEFNLRNPMVIAHGVAQNDFGQLLEPMFQEALTAIASGGAAITAEVQEALDRADRLLASAEATAEEIREAILALRSAAQSAVDQQRSTVNTRASQMNSARSARDSAWRLYADTPARQVALRAQRYTAYVAAQGRFVTASGLYNTARAVLSAREAVLAATPHPDESLVLLAAQAAVAELRAQVQQTQQRLAVLEERFRMIADALERGEQLLAIQRAEFRAELSGALRGGAMGWSIAGTFVGSPFTMERKLDFSNLGQAAAAIVDGLIRA